jgi:hypothetical protein
MHKISFNVRKLDGKGVRIFDTSVRGWVRLAEKATKLKFQINFTHQKIWEKFIKSNATTYCWCNILSTHKIQILKKQLGDEWNSTLCIALISGYGWHHWKGKQKYKLEEIIEWNSDGIK